MNAVRSVISVFLVALLAIAIAGWIWAGGQPEAKMLGARAVLGLCGVLSLGSLAVLWTAKQPRAE